MRQLNLISKLKISGRITSVILFAASVVLFTECKRTAKDEVALGGENKAASSNFYVANGPNGFFVPYQYQVKKGVAKELILSLPSGQANTAIVPVTFISSVNPAVPPSYVFFKAKLSESVSWNITITGLNSGATKIISGTSDSLNASNTTWDGNSTGIPFFQSDELAVAKLTIFGSTVSYLDTIRIASPKSYNGLVQNGVKYIVLDDFEAQSPGAFPFASVSSDALDAATISFRTASDTVVSGKKSFYLSGTDINWNGYLVAKTTSGDLTPYFGITTTDDTQLYFNIYIYGTGRPNTTISLEAFENEHPGLAPLNLASNDGWIFDIMVNWTGWKLVSIPYSSFKKAPNPLSGGNGNGRREPNLISGASFTLNSFPTAGKNVGAYVDFVVLSVGGPFAQ